VGCSALLASHRVREGAWALAELPSGTVTFLFTDLEGSTRLWEEHPEAMRAALAQHDEILRDAIAANGGHVVKGTGDGLYAVFATAGSAIAAAVAGQQAVARVSSGPIGTIRVRMGLHTGVAEERDGDYFGGVLNRAARLMSVAHAGQVLCSQATADLVRDALPPSAGLADLGRHRLRDIVRAEAVFQVTHPDLPGDFPPLRSLDAVVGNLPRQVTSFVGRGREVVAIAEELTRTPVVTLTGVGGVGKTRLALEVASQVQAEYRDGAWICELAGVRDADAVPDAVVDTFGLERRQGLGADALLIEFLRAKQLVLVLDNCEHQLKTVARLVSEIVSACPGVRVLATSREGLNVAGERILVVASLEVPDDLDDADGADLAAIAASDAVRLFVERAQAVRAGFVLDGDNAGAVAQVCLRLDGVPLAIELAAARVGMLTPTELAARLDQRFRVLTGGGHGSVERHQTLRAAIDWSYELLAEAEQLVLDRLCVFAGGFTLEAAEAVTAGDGIDSADVFELVAGLVARSLVVADAEGSETRYRLLETIRQYAQERLDARGDTARVRAGHAGYYARFAEAAAAGLMSPDELAWLARFGREVDNVRAGLAWVVGTGDVETTVRYFALTETLRVAASEAGAVLRGAVERALTMPGITEHPRLPVVLAVASVRRASRATPNVPCACATRRSRPRSGSGSSRTRRCGRRARSSR